MFENEYIFLLLPLGVISVMACAYGVMAVAAGRAWAAMTLLFVTIFLLDTIFRARAYSDKSIDFQIILKAGSWMALFLFALLHLPRYAGALFRAPHILWLLLFCWFLATTPNSPNPTYSAIAVFSVVTMYLGLMAMLTDYDHEMVLSVLLASCLLVVIASLFAYFAIPSLGRLEEWQGNAQIQGNRLSGITGTPNGIGLISAWCTLVIAIRWASLRRYLGWGVLIFGGLAALITLALSQSRTSMAILAALTGLTFAVRQRSMPYLLIGGALVASAVLIFAVNDSDLFLRMLSRSGNVLELETGTGRAQIWSLVIKLSQLNFWTGYGYASSVFIIPDYTDYIGHAPPHAHNMLLQLWLTTGMIGVILFSLAFTAQIFRAISNKDSLSLTFLLFIMLDGITEPSAFAGVAHLSTVVLMFAIARSVHRPFVTPAVRSPTWQMIAEPVRKNLIR